MAKGGAETDGENTEPVHDGHGLPDDHCRDQACEGDAAGQREDDHIVIQTRFERLGNQVGYGEKRRGDKYRQRSQIELGKAWPDDDKRAEEGDHDRRDSPQPELFTEIEGRAQRRVDRPEIQQCVHLGKRYPHDGVEPAKYRQRMADGADKKHLPAIFQPGGSQRSGNKRHQQQDSHHISHEHRLDGRKVDEEQPHAHHNEREQKAARNHPGKGSAHVQRRGGADVIAGHSERLSSQNSGPPRNAGKPIPKIQAASAISAFSTTPSATALRHSPTSGVSSPEAMASSFAES